MANTKAIKAYGRVGVGPICGSNNSWGKSLRFTLKNYKNLFSEFSWKDSVYVWWKESRHSPKD